MAAKKPPLEELEQYIPLTAVIEFAQELIRIPSLSGNELRCVQNCMQRGKHLGFETQIDPMGNYIGRIKVGSGLGKKIILSGHLDTVNAQPSQWSESTQPFDGSLQDDKLYGRGASDMKAALAAMHQAAFAISHLPEGFCGEVFVVGTVVEELFEGVCFLEAMEQIQPDYVIIGEASQCNLNIGTRGRAEVSIAVPGISTHACIGRTTINPIEQAAYVVDTFHRFYQAEKDDLLLGSIACIRGQPLLPPTVLAGAFLHRPTLRHPQHGQARFACSACSPRRLIAQRRPTSRSLETHLTQGRPLAWAYSLLSKCESRDALFALQGCWLCALPALHFAASLRSRDN